MGNHPGAGTDTYVTIRRKLLFLLLGVTLTPLIAISAFRQIAVRLARRRLTAKIQATLVSNASLQLQQLLESYDEILAREVRLMDALAVHKSGERAAHDLSRV